MDKVRIIIGLVAAVAAIGILFTDMQPLAARIGAATIVAAFAVLALIGRPRGWNW